MANAALSARYGVVFVGVGIFPYRICGDKNFLLDLGGELKRKGIETRFVSIVNGPRDLPPKPHFTYIGRAFHRSTEKYVRRDRKGSIISYRHEHSIPRTWVEIVSTLFRHRATINRTLDEFDNVVVHWMDSSLLLPAIRRVCGPDRRYVQTVFRYRAALSAGQKLRTYSLRSADRIATGTEASRRLLLADGCRPESVVVAPWGCKPRQDNRGSMNNKKLRILWSGFIQQIGRADFLRTIELAKRVSASRPDIDFVFSLKPECYEPEFGSLATDGVRVVVGDPSFESQLSNYDALLSPVMDAQSSAAPPLTWIEALSAGLPVISTEHPGALEALGSGSCGIVSPSYAVLEQLLLSPMLASQLSGMRAAAQQHQRANYNIETLGEQYAQIYDSLFSIQ